MYKETCRGTTEHAMRNGGKKNFDNPLYGNENRGALNTYKEQLDNNANDVTMTVAFQIRFIHLLV